MELKVLRIEDLVPYKNNPRHNDDAVDAVAESIKQCGYISPIVIDENNEVLAGHTRLKALIKLGVKECQCIIAKGLTEEQKKKYRILDNKVGELATWDFAKLDMELEGLDFGDFDFGFETQTISDADLEGLFGDAEPKQEKEEKQIQCPLCKEWFTP